MGLFTQYDGNALEWRGEHEIVRVEAWGPDALRARGTVWQEIRDDQPGALLEGEPARAGCASCAPPTAPSC
jgi:alpha-D-xyloside xylohydrolase